MLTITALAIRKACFHAEAQPRLVADGEPAGGAARAARRASAAASAFARQADAATAPLPFGGGRR